MSEPSISQTQASSCRFSAGAEGHVTLNEEASLLLVTVQPLEIIRAKGALHPGRLAAVHHPVVAVAVLIMPSLGMSRADSSGSAQSELSPPGATLGLSGVSPSASSLSRCPTHQYRTDPDRNTAA